MRIRMRDQISGTRNGEPWPPPGGEVDLPDAEAVKYCANGLAVPVAAKDTDVEKAVPGDDLDELRDQAKAAGVKVDKRWGAERLQDEIDAAKESG
jgi:hypothetical protein